MNGKEKFQRAFKIGAVRRCVLKCEGRQNEIKHKYLGEDGKLTWPSIKNPTDPSLIQWKNLGIGRIERFCRSFAVYVASGLILLIGFITILAILKFQDDFKSETLI